MSMMLDRSDEKTETGRLRSEVIRTATSASWFLPIVNALAWVGLVSLVMTVAPAVDPDAPIDVFGLVISEVFWAAALGSGIGLLMRARWAYALTGVGGAALLLGAVSCFAGGHTGAWIGVQALAGIGLAATGTSSWRVSR